jgi:hypothetical protein
MPGPPPKRSDQRRRRNEPARPVVKPEGAGEVEVPRANSQWHPTAKRWYASLAASGQSVFFEPSDWAMAYVVAESISRELKPQAIVTQSGKVVKVAQPPKAASLAAWLKAAGALMMTEGDRRRLGVELQRPQPDGEEATPDVSELDEWRDRLRGSAG